MGNILDKNFREFIDYLNKNDVEYLLVGGYAVVLHGYPRYTGDMDIWVSKTSANYLKLVKAFEAFAMPVFDMTLPNFLGSQFDVFTFGKVPYSIEILTDLKGLDFDKAYQNYELKEMKGLSVKMLNLQDLYTSKQASARMKDLADIEELKKIKK
jgi:hypothetical protein